MSPYSCTNSSSAIDRLRTLHLGSAKQALLYHFFTVSDRRSQTCDTLVRTLVYQISSHDDATRAHAKRHYLNEGGNGLADLDQLFSMLVDVASILSGTCIVIDALDECVDQKESCAFLEKFFKRLLPGVRILTSSNTTQARLTEVVLTRLNTEKVYIATPNVNRDIETHILDSDLDQWDDDQKSRIIRHITENSDGS